MTAILFDAPYNIDAVIPRLKHFYFVIPTASSDEETVLEEMELFEQLQQAMPQWAVQHIYTRETIFGANQPVFTEDYAVVYFSMVDGSRIPVTTMLSDFSYSDINYADVSA